MIMTLEEISNAAEELAALYNDAEQTRIDPDEKARLYALARQFPEVHYKALEINKNKCIRRW